MECVKRKWYRTEDTEGKYTVADAMVLLKIRSIVFNYDERLAGNT